MYMYSMAWIYNDPTLILDLCMYGCIYVNVIYGIWYLCVCYLWSKVTMYMYSMAWI